MKIRTTITTIIILLSNILAIAGNVAEFSLITCSPGKEIYELEGHTGLRIKFSEDNDWIANWGVFDFDTPNFAYRFTKGETDYIMAIEPTGNFLERYRLDGRTVTEQPIVLSEEEALELYNLLRENALPENRVYRYNYIKDNCATRPLALIEKAIGDTLQFHQSLKFRSFRDAMACYHHNYPWYQFGIDIALGSGIDKPTSVRDECFAPVRLQELFENATRSNGTRIAGDSKTLVAGVNHQAEAPTPLLLSPIFTGWLVFSITILICLGSIGRKHIPKIWTAILFTILGIAGLVTTFLIFISSHEATSPNLLYLWLNPIPLLIVPNLFIKRLEKLAYWLQIINFVAILLMLITAVADVQSFNSAFYPLIISTLMCSFTYIYVIRWQKKHQR